MSDDKLFNEIAYVIEGQKIPFFNKEVKGFAKSLEEEYLNIKNFITGKIYVFDDLFNSQPYNRKDAFDILGPCFLTSAIKYSDIKDKNLERVKQMEIKRILNVAIPIWKSEDSRYFVLANNLKNSKDQH